MIDCWQEDLQARPSFETLRNRMKSFEENHQVFMKFITLKLLSETDTNDDVVVQLNIFSLCF